MLPDLPLPAAECYRRQTQLSDMLVASEIDCAIILGPEPQYWLSGYDSFLGSVLSQALVFRPTGEQPALIVWDADVAIADQTSLVRDIRTYRFGVDDPTNLFVRAALDQRRAVRRIGVDLSSHAVSYKLGLELVGALSGIDVIDISEDLARLRAIKSADELALMRLAGRYGRLGLAAAREHAKSGCTEIELAGEIEYAMRTAGSDYASIPTEMSSGSRSIQGHGTPTSRRLEAGDVIHVEIGGVERRYNSVAIQTFIVPGAQPTQEARDLYNLALDCLRSGLDQLKPGVAAADVEAPALEIIRQTGHGDNFKMRFGYGVGIGYPPTWLEPLKITRTSTDILVPGTTFVLHACLLDESISTGVLVGGTYAINDRGFELLSGAGDVELM